MGVERFGPDPNFLLQTPPERRPAMKRPRKSAKKSRRLKVIRLWNYPEAVRVVPYLRSVIDALRNHYLDSLRHRLTVKRLSARKPERSNLIALEDARKDLDRSQDSFKDAHREL